LLFCLLGYAVVPYGAGLTVAFVTVAERKTMASMQKILGPNIIGYHGLVLR